MSACKRVALGAFAKSVEYGVTAAATLQPVGPKFLRITDIQDGVVNWDTVPWCECDARSAENSRLQEGDIVFARTGATTGKSFLIRDCPIDAVFASYLIRVRVGEEADPRYVSHFFQTRDYWAQITRGARGVAQPGVNATTLKAIQVPLPPVPEQVRIAEVLDLADTLRTKRRVALAQLDVLSQSMFYGLFGNPATNPNEFPKRTLASLVRDDDTINYGVVQPGDDLEEGVPLIRVGDLSDGRVNHSVLKRIAPAIEANYQRSRLRGDEILLSCVGSIGVVALADESVKGFNIARAIARIPLAESTNRIYMAAYLNTDFAQRYFTNELRTVSQPTLNIKQIAETTVMTPPMSLQLEFARRFTSVERLRTLYRASLAEKDALFAALQHRAFRGEL